MTMKVKIEAGSIGTNVVAEVAHVQMPASSEATAEQVRALLLAANPPGTTRLRIDEEVRSIDEAIRRGLYRDRFQLVTQLAVRSTDLADQVLRHRPALLHFAGHGARRGLILDDDGLGIAELEHLVALLGGRIRCIVLNACLSEAQAEALAAHVPSVIGMAQSIADPSAIAFSIAFYEGLAHGESVRTAFELGKARFEHVDRGGTPRDVVGAEPVAGAAPVLLGREDARAIRLFGA